MNKKKNKKKKETQRIKKETEVDKQKRKSFGRTQSQSYKHNILESIKYIANVNYDGLLSWWEALHSQRMGPVQV